MRLIGGDPYAALGVRPFINAAGARTLHGGAPVDRRVRAAMDRAADAHVDLDELMAAASRRLAGMTGAQAGVVTAGAAAGLAMAAAACIFGRDPVRVLGPRGGARQSDVLVPRGQRFAYDPAYRLAGGQIVEVSDEAELMAALPRAALIALLGHSADTGPLPFERLRRVAPETPIVVDAAAEPLALPERWTGRGADLVIYSGGKLLAGPQGTGLLLGRADLVEAAWRHAAPHLAPLRVCKVTKEEIVGLLAALDLWAARDPEAQRSHWDRTISAIAEGLPDLRPEYIAPMPGGIVPRLRLHLDPRTMIDGPTLWQRLDAGTPRVVLRELGARDWHVEIDPFCLQSDEVDKLIGAIQSAVTLPPPPTAQQWSAPPGQWRYVIADLTGTIWLKPDGTGHHSSSEMSGPARATPTGVLLATDVDGQIATYRLHVQHANGAELCGWAALGTSRFDDDGPDRSADQFGIQTFTLIRQDDE